jgi:AAA15 family ATPase/GTPase
MTRITAIEIENFQSIERRTRIEFKPLTLLFGPNSAGKSSIFDALELLNVLLDPTKFDSDLATKMLDRWARRNKANEARTTTLAIEFPFAYIDMYDVWADSTNWTNNLIQSHETSFYWNYEDVIEPDSLEGETVRIELQLSVLDDDNTTKAFLSECSLSVKDQFLFRVTKKHPSNAEVREFREITKNDFHCFRYLTLYDPIKYGFTTHTVFNVIEVIMALRPIAITKAPFPHIEEDKKNDYQIATDALFYFGTILFQSHRNKPGVVVSDRRAPKPAEALSVVDLGLGGWWSRNSFSPSSPAAILKSSSKELDEHYQGLAEVAYAELLLRTANHDFWGGNHAAKYIEEVRSKAKILDIVNAHLERSLFTEKLYKLSCAATLMVPIDLDEDDPWSYYALAQPAAVRLFLEDGNGQKVDFHDVGSGIPFVLPILFAAVNQGFVKVQQPELHLHPALQSSLADVFVEELNRVGSGQFLVETHSEHLLLRLLRRIRDTEKQQSFSDDMRLTNRDIAVYYFDPRVDGGTVVTQQLVTPLGDFYTDWPRGFFAERNRDLFDE